MGVSYPRDLLVGFLEERALRLSEAQREAAYALVDTLFFASLMAEESEPVRVAIVHHEGGAAGLAQVMDTDCDPEEGASPAWNVTAISKQRFDARSLAKLSRGIEYGTQLVVVGGTGAELWIEGIARRLPRTDGGDAMRIAAPRPGVLVFEEGFEEALRFEAGERVPPSLDVLGRHGPVRNAVGAITGDSGAVAEDSSGPGLRTFYSYTESALLQLLRRMRATGAGAILAMLPAAPSQAVLEQVKYRLLDATVLATRIHTHKRKQRAAFGVRIATADTTTLHRDQVEALDAARAEAEALDAAIEDVARLSAIDGAVLTGPHLELYGAGYIIPSLPLPLPPLLASDPRMTDVQPYPARHGARHHAAFSFAQENPGAVAFVVSEDGPVSCALRVEDRVVVWPVRLSET
jgi:hypothetical protein